MQSGGKLELIVCQTTETNSMSPQRMVNVDQSVRLLKLFWWLLQEGQEGVSFEYLHRDPNEITVKSTLYNIQQVIDWLPPYVPGPAEL